MSETILVTGGTGVLGRQVARRLLAPGREVRVLSRRTAPPGTPYAWRTGDLRTHQGIDSAVRGADVIVHCATTLGGRDVATTKALVDTARRHGMPHVVFISIVGIDRIPLPYYRAKLAAEEAVVASGLPSTILRATQFHDLVCRIVDIQRFLPAVLYPAGFRVQPVDAGEVAARLVELALGEPAGRGPDMGGPEVRDFADLARITLRARGRRRVVIPVPFPGATARAYRAGHHLTPNATGRVTFEEYLAAQAAIA
ncbi:nucleotide-diphosphate-sugar epimerase [Amycolatopsis deserti]|uniref:Nucleotide-diphosphate-sugar epimerase n=1 Tax=Amycolatopsis deserti TaxID=185696 RepID=A0ABQ3J5M9_9PSEU|nr:NAD(P)H-binding protein [Amycolatopsis deserti]GHF05974.1 nucleotide-diphosphate-sugar epimerase [Amycolatopsis deserti]